MRDIDSLLYSLSKSKFRSSFHLNKKLKEYVNDKGLEKWLKIPKGRELTDEEVSYIVKLLMTWIKNEINL